MKLDLAQSYEILGLSFNASFHDVKKAYRSLVKKWHPDPFHSDSKLYKKCEEKLKRVNGAHDFLESHLSNKNHASWSTETTEYARRQAEQAKRERAKEAAWTRKEARAKAEEEAKAREEARARAEAEAKKKKRAEERVFAKQQNEAAVKKFKRFRQLARQGIAEAQFHVAMMYRDAIGCARNQTEASKWLKKAARNGDLKAALYFGFAFAWGIGVGANTMKAIEIFQLAAKNGIAEAQFQLGLLHYFGFGVEQNYQQSINFCREAMEQGYKIPLEERYNACGHLGRKIPKQYFKHCNWYLLAVKRESIKS